ncbi:MAG: hypothetical protein H8E13_21560 [Actinobacteria bacterium]|nr:hypothetical protein [Actinomycetota bacterium]
MAELLDQNEMMFQNFEPKTKRRYMMYVEGLPAFLIKGASRPQITHEEIVLDHINVKRYVKGASSWAEMSGVSLYDPVVPSAAQAVME